ncbi:hypothetical protein [Streptomyces glaucus]|uniref:CBS domain-containing protein n=1 Tax=Streptomyces glaucus TaxID=284029 RepID=A0ABN3JPP6_9ACTN
MEETARAMPHGGFRHPVVPERGEPAGIVPVRALSRCRVSLRRRARHLPACAGPSKRNGPDPP